MNDVTPIQRYYDGYHFRSTLEARWAVFFDFLKIRYKYETQRYRVHFHGYGASYLPDFKLYGYRGGQILWAEVKGVSTISELLKKDIDVFKVKAFSLDHPIIFLPNIPVNIEAWLASEVTTSEYIKGAREASSVPLFITKDDANTPGFFLKPMAYPGSNDADLTEQALRVARAAKFKEEAENEPKLSMAR